MDVHPGPRGLDPATLDLFTLLHHLPDRVTVTDREGVIVYVNPAFEDVTGFNAQEAIGQKPSIIKSGKHPREFYENLWRTVTSGRPFRAEVVNRKRSGELYVEDQLIVPIFDRAKGRGAGPCGFISIARDMTDRKALEERIRFLAEHDELTGLLNRRGLLREAGAALERAAEAGEPLSLLFVDLNNFKAINDVYGHRTGDLVLAHAARTIAGSVRKDDLCGRWGGDEFVLLLPGTDLKAARAIARRIRAELEVPARIDGVAPVVYLQASIGIAGFPVDGRNIEDLTRIADEAMYAAKERPGGVAHVQDGAKAKSRLRLVVEIPSALRLGQLHLHYQPILDLKTRKITKVEALLRWRHPQMGMVRPDQFIALAEKSRDIVAIDHWAICEAIEQMELYRREGAGFDVAVNVSGRTLEEGSLPALIEEIGSASPEALRRLIVEVTEGAFVRLDRAWGTLERLRRRGVRVAIDDFGTGYSCLAYLKDLPADIVKIDRRFIEGIGSKRRSEAIVRAIISLSAELGCRSIAEGVEDGTQLEWLTGAGCHEAQGYWIAKPLPINRMARLVAERSWAPGTPGTPGQLQE